MICPRCNNQLPDNSVACNRCGMMFSYPQPIMQAAPPKKSTKKLIIGLVSGILGVIILVIAVFLIIVNMPQEIDYGDAASFEKALNDGKNVDGAVVRFEIQEYKHTLLGDNLWGGNHLNFYGNPKGASKGDTIVVKVKNVKNFDGSWMVYYRRVNNSKVTQNTITSSD